MRNDIDTRTIVKQVFSRSHFLVWEPSTCTHARAQTHTLGRKLIHTHAHTRKSPCPNGDRPCREFFSMFFFYIIIDAWKRHSAQRQSPRKFPETTRNPLPDTERSGECATRRGSTNCMSFKPHNNNKKTVSVVLTSPMIESASSADDSSVSGFCFFFILTTNGKLFFSFFCGVGISVALALLAPAQQHRR